MSNGKLNVSDEFILRNIAGDNLLIPTGAAANQVKGMILMSESALLLYEKLKKGCTKAELISALLAEYDVSENIPDDITTGQEISLPMTAADGKLEISGLFTYSGINPDCSNQEENDIASITVSNISDEYLAECSVKITLSDGTTANFKVTDLPAGSSIMAFSTENAVLEADAVCVDLSCEASFDPQASMSEDELSVSTDGMTVTLTNVSGRELSNIVVYCHDILEPDYFGGITYIYKIEKIAVDETVTVDATDCVLGITEVVRINTE